MPASTAPLTVLFDGGCPLCRRTARVFRRLDWRHQLRFVDGTNAAARAHAAPSVTEAQVLVEMYVVDTAGHLHGGYDGYLVMARRLPLLWPVAWLGSLPGLRQAGVAIYRFIAANRVRRGRCTDEACEPAPAASVK